MVFEGYMIYSRVWIFLSKVHSEWCFGYFSNTLQKKKKKKSKNFQYLYIVILLLVIQMKDGLNDSSFKDLVTDLKLKVFAR